MKTNKIKYKGQEFETRIIDGSWYDENYGDMQVADSELWFAISDGYEKGGALENEIDNDIFFYCDCGFLASKPKDEDIIEYLERNVL